MRTDYVDLTDMKMDFRKCWSATKESSAVQVKAGFQVQAPKGTMVGKYGDYIMEDFDGTRYVLSKESFELLFKWGGA